MKSIHVRATSASVTAFSGGLVLGALIVASGVFFSSHPGEPPACQTQMVLR